MANTPNLLGGDMSTSQELLIYLKRPVFTANRQSFDLQSLRQMWQLLGLTLMLAFLGVIVAGGLYMAIEGDPPQVSKDYENLAKTQAFFWMAILIAPVIEELVFRSWMGRVGGILCAMPVILCMSAVLSLSRHSAAMPNVSVLLTAIMFGAMVIYLRRYMNTRHQLEFHNGVVARIFPYVFWGAGIMFALVHLSNYAQAGFKPHMILLVVPQFIVGVVLAYVRMRYGLLQAIGFHAAYNGVFVFLGVLGQKAAGILAGVIIMAF